MLNAVIIDSQNLFREGFKLLVSTLNDYDFKFTDLSIEELLEDTISISPDLIFLELGEKELDEISKIKQLRKKHKQSKIAVLSTFSNTKVVREVFQCGVDAYFLKNTSLQKLAEGLDEVFNGQTFMTEGLRLTPEKGHKPKSEVRQNLYNNNFQIKQKLTKREHEVLDLIVQAKSNIEIGQLLFISEQTVGVHKKNIMRKLAVHNTVSLIRFAIDNNLA